MGTESRARTGAVNRFSNPVFYFPFLPKIIFFDFKLLLTLFTVVAVVTILSGYYPALILSSQNPLGIFNSQKENKPGLLKKINAVHARERKKMR